MRAIGRISFLIVIALALAAAVPFVPDFLPADESDRAAWRGDLGRLETPVPAESPLRQAA